MKKNAQGYNLDNFVKFDIHPARRREMKKYYVVYVEGCSPKLYEAKTQKSLNLFLSKFIKKYGSEWNQSGDNWIDYIFEGKKMNLEVFTKVK